ncbi:MAG: hypothetical protein EOO05_02795 [Chitinophagaceae bacterium]|nr:MAG: hypothetical protein EOO05_02795 [Chitinophagaceae bacterium]
MKTLFFSLLLLSLSIAFLAGCQNNKDELLNPPSDCDTTDVRYSTSIVRILQANCYLCHRAATNTGGPNLDSYALLAVQAGNGKLLGTVSHASGFLPMPQGGTKLNDCDIATIRVWVEAGFPNN